MLLYFPTAHLLDCANYTMKTTKLALTLTKFLNLIFCAWLPSSKIEIENVFIYFFQLMSRV